VITSKMIKITIISWLTLSFKKGKYLQLWVPVWLWTTIDWSLYSWLMCNRIVGQCAVI